ncbi:MAG: MTH1187 family thiamine-binding protein [Leptospirales bacterium]
MSILLEFSMFPTDVGESKSEYVARSISIIKKSGLPYKMGPMGTVIEGEWDEVMAVVKQCQEAMSSDCNRVYSNIKIDSRKGKSGRLQAKIESVKTKLGEDINS